VDLVSSRGGATLGAEGEEALAKKDGLRPVDMITRLVEKRGYTYLGPWTFQRPWKRDDRRSCWCCC
jgi:hypothetical protein